MDLLIWVSKVNLIEGSREFIKLRMITKVISTLPKDKYKVAFYTPFNIYKFLSNAKDPVPNHLKSGIYKLSCQDCNTTYVGKTARNFYTRIFKEHFYYWRTSSQDKSNFSDHLISSSHNFDPSLNSTLIRIILASPTLKY